MRIDVANIPFISPMSKNSGTNYTHTVNDKYPVIWKINQQLTESGHMGGSTDLFAEDELAVLQHGAPRVTRQRGHAAVDQNLGTKKAGVKEPWYAEARWGNDIIYWSYSVSPPPTHTHLTLEQWGALGYNLRTIKNPQVTSDSPETWWSTVDQKPYQA